MAVKAGNCLLASGGRCCSTCPYRSGLWRAWCASPGAAMPYHCSSQIWRSASTQVTEAATVDPLGGGSYAAMHLMAHRMTSQVNMVVRQPWLKVCVTSPPPSLTFSHPTAPTAGAPSDGFKNWLAAHGRHIEVDCTNHPTSLPW